ncbi:MAG TPA: RecX family transcriptional regulator, partial [Candidatus Saccharimonadales bacterium]|nr:RecX family transcriptional regulator [Candidatus Saccharimonadales bacterium]
TQQQRRKDRYAIHVDGAYCFSLSQAQLVAAGLRSGDTLTPDQIVALQETAEVGKAFDQAYNYIAYRFRSRNEVATHLQGKGHDAERIRQVIQLLEQQQLVDDQRFASEWIEMRQTLSPRSRVQLRVELRKKGILADIIEAALKPVDADAEIAALVALIESKRLLYRYDDQRKLIRYLAGKGFRFDLITAALEQLDA